MAEASAPSPTTGKAGTWTWRIPSPSARLVRHCEVERRSPRSSIAAFENPSVVSELLDQSPLSRLDTLTFDAERRNDPAGG